MTFIVTMASPRRFVLQTGDSGAYLTADRTRAEQWARDGDTAAADELGGLQELAGQPPKVEALTDHVLATYTGCLGRAGDFSAYCRGKLKSRDRMKRTLKVARDAIDEIASVPEGMPYQVGDRIGTRVAMDLFGVVLAGFNRSGGTEIRAWDEQWWDEIRHYPILCSQPYGVPVEATLPFYDVDPAAAIADAFRHAVAAQRTLREQHPQLLGARLSGIALAWRGPSAPARAAFSVEISDDSAVDAAAATLEQLAGETTTTADSAGITIPDELSPECLIARGVGRAWALDADVDEAAAIVTDGVPDDLRRVLLARAGVDDPAICEAFRRGVATVLEGGTA